MDTTLAGERFAKYFNKSPQNLGAEHVREYLLHLIRDNHAMPSTVLVNRAALRFVYVCTLKQNWFEDEIPQPKRRLTLPGILSTEEVTRMLDGTHNLKHWSILATFYATALRCSELQHLRVDDVDSKRMVLHVREGKGRVPRGTLVKTVSKRLGHANAKVTMDIYAHLMSGDDERAARVVQSLRQEAAEEGGATRPHERHICTEPKIS